MNTNTNTNTISLEVQEETYNKWLELRSLVLNIFKPNENQIVPDDDILDALVFGLKQENPPVETTNETECTNNKHEIIEDDESIKEEDYGPEESLDEYEDVWPEGTQSDIIVFNDKSYNLENFTSKNFPQEFYAWLEKQIYKDFDSSEDEVRKNILSEIKDRWGGIDNVRDYYRLRTYYKLTCKINEQEPVRTITKQNSPKSEDETRFDIRYYFTITYGMTQNEMEDFEKGILPKWFSPSTTPYKMSKYPDIHYESQSDFILKSCNYFDKPKSVSTFLSLLLALYLNANNCEKENGFAAHTIKFFENALEARLDVFKFNPKRDERVDFFMDFVNELTTKQETGNLDEQQMYTFCNLIPFTNQGTPITDFDFMRNKYISDFGKPWKEEQEIEYESPDFNAGQFLPLDLSALKNLVIKTTHDEEDHWIKAIKINDETMVEYIKFIEKNRKVLIDNGYATEWHIPSGPFKGDVINEQYYLNDKQRQFLEANLFFMGFHSNQIQNIIDIFYKYKGKGTILKRIIDANDYYGKPMSEEILEELLTVEFN